MSIRLRFAAGALATLPPLAFGASMQAYAQNAATAPPSASAFSFGMGELIGMASVAVTLILGIM